jgi:hypothetical protein
MRFSKLFFLALVATLFLALTPTQTQAKGSLGMTAAAGMPNGFTPSVGLPSNVYSRLTISLAASSSFNIMLSDAFQLDLGLGYLSITPDGGDAANTLSFGVGGKYFLDQGDVRPYINVALSYSQIPTVESGSTKTSGNLLTFIGAFGAQAFINSSNTVALFVQMGIGYNTGTLTMDNGVMSSDNTVSSLNLGGSAIGATVYF